ncbi:hypothetical protein NLJ89_g8334 [Agrocybe chaxingu]|uniref:Uncharacterized protein n=1 Tax=Agrocybe chaxingu TaxID=84603 RepID=A0A9W8MQV8_9AGAR|nr:hypothetical protein NLJ89_g8334 [Agrocybe chaxingu]
MDLTIYALHALYIAKGIDMEEGFTFEEVLDHVARKGPGKVTANLLRRNLTILVRVPLPSSLRGSDTPVWKHTQRYIYKGPPGSGAENRYFLTRLMNELLSI